MDDDGSTLTSSRKDPGWKYNYLKDAKDPNMVTCTFCEKTTKGGIHRAKQHQVGNSRNTTKCQKCPPQVKQELERYMNEKKTQKASFSSCMLEDFDEAGDDEFEENEIIGDSSRVRVGQKRGNELSLSGNSKRGPGFTKEVQMDDCDKEFRNRTIQHIARFFYQAEVAFSATKLDSFKQMIEAIGRYGSSLNPPSYHELRVPLLKNELDYTSELLSKHKLEWAKHGCSVMSNGWTGRNNRNIVNLMVNCSLGTMFLESVDASSIVKNGEEIFKLLDTFVDRVGENNIVQVVTDSGSNYKVAGRLLEAKRPCLFWTPCAAHCVDLMLEDIGKISQVKKTIERGIFLVGFIYNLSGVLNMMRRFTRGKNLVRQGVTRLTTTFLTLSSIHKQKNNLRDMFASDEWMNSRWVKEANCKRATDIMVEPSFWNDVVYTLKVMGPLIRVLRLIGNVKKPAMGYIYEAMDRAKETIQKSFNGDEEKYEDIFKIIDGRWNCQLHQPLHAAGHYLNPELFYYNPSIEADDKVVAGLYKCVAKLVSDSNLQDKIMNELLLYKKAEGLFGNPMAIRSRKTRSPAEWWSLFGCSTPNLQQLAIRILSLTCSATCRERNWSVFEHIHSKKRNKLSHKKLQDLVYVKYNQALKALHDVNHIVDPILLNEIDDCNEWLVGEMGANMDAAEEELVRNDGDMERAAWSWI